MTDNIVRFEAINGQSLFFVGDENRYGTSAQAFLFDFQTGTVLEHGPESEVRAKFSDCVQAFEALGFPETDLVVIGFEPENFDARVFTRFIDTPGYLAAWYAVNKSTPGLKKLPA